MLGRFARASTFLLLLAACRGQGGTEAPNAGTLCAEAQAEHADPLAGLDGRVERIMKAHDVPGLSIAVVKDGKVVTMRGYGVREAGKPDPVDGDTAFAIASLTKAFTATAVGLLVDEGKIDWDDRVVEHIPDLVLWDDFTTKQIQVYDLLAHNSGLDTWAGDLAWIGSKIDNATLLSRLRHVPPSAGFRERYGYSNLMFVVAGELIRRKTEKTWDVFVRERLLDPLGMSRTTTSVKALPSQENVATPHMGEGAEQFTIPYLDVDNAGAAGALNSSARDMARWMALQLADGKHEGKQLVPAEVVAELRVPHTPVPLPEEDSYSPPRHFIAYGMGWFLADYRGRLLVGHGGGLPGMRSRVVLVPEESLGIVVLTNSETSAAFYLATELVDAYLGAPHRDYSALARARKAEKAKEEIEPAAKPEATSLPTSKYAGSYENALLGTTEVREKGGALELEVSDHGGLDCPLLHADKDTFTCKWSDPIFETSRVHFDVERGRAHRVRFKVRPSFIDPIEHAFERKR
jgi:CubicO group peptidase (beta-lactamase class C family)